MNLRSSHQNVLVVIEFFTVTCAQFFFVLFFKLLSLNVFDAAGKSLFSISKVRVFFFFFFLIVVKYTVLTIFKFIVQWHSHC